MHMDVVKDDLLKFKARNRTGQRIKVTLNMAWSLVPDRLLVWVLLSYWDFHTDGKHLEGLQSMVPKKKKQIASENRQRENVLLMPGDSQKVQPWCSVYIQQTAWLATLLGTLSKQGVTKGKWGQLLIPFRLVQTRRGTAIPELTQLNGNKFPTILNWWESAAQDALCHFPSSLPLSAHVLLAHSARAR